MKTKILVLLVLGCAAGCGGDSTTGHTVALKTVATSDLGPDRTFVTSSGWTVTLTKAALATGAFYYYDGEPAFVSAPSRRPSWWARLAPVGTAHAHPGHYVAGRAMGQMLLPFSADLLAGPTALPDGSGVTGLVRSASFSFAAPSAGPALAALGGHAAITEGVATKGDKVVHFALAADLADVAHTAKDGIVTGCAFAEHDVEASGTVTVTVKPRVWFNLVDFSELPPGTAEAPSVAAADSTAHIAFALGLAQLSAYAFTYSTP
jgi:hypothetical protein